MTRTAIFSPGPSYFNEQVRINAGWVHILDMYREGLEELGFDVFIPEHIPELIDDRNTVSKMLSHDIVAAKSIRKKFWGEKPPDLFLGPPGYSLVQMMSFPHGDPTRFLYVWNNHDSWRDEQLVPEYTMFDLYYDQSPIWRWVNTTALQLAEHVISCSPWVKKTHARVIPEKKISINPWGVDHEHFRPAQIPPADLPLRVLFVGSDPVRKGLAYLMDKASRLENVVVWIVGCAPITEEEMQPNWKQFGMVPHSQMLELYQQCHVICIPTLEDGIALAIQEGMACGLVPVGTPEVAEVFQHEIWNKQGQCGYPVDYRKSSQLEAIIRHLRDHVEARHEFGRRAREVACGMSWNDTKASFKAIIRQEMGIAEV